MFLKFYKTVELSVTEMMYAQICRISFLVCTIKMFIDIPNYVRIIW